jgi:hypothetical protein
MTASASESPVIPLYYPRKISTMALYHDASRFRGRPPDSYGKGRVAKTSPTLSQPSDLQARSPADIIIYPLSPSEG